MPVWDWGGLRSKLHQSETRERQAQVTLSQTQRQLVGNLYSMYNEALTRADRRWTTCSASPSSLAESLRLTNLRYQAGESTALEVVDAQNTLVQARNAADDAEDAISGGAGGTANRDRKFLSDGEASNVSVAPALASVVCHCSRLRRRS